MDFRGNDKWGVSGGDGDRDDDDLGSAASLGLLSYLCSQWVLAGCWLANVCRHFLLLVWKERQVTFSFHCLEEHC